MNVLTEKVATVGVIGTNAGVVIGGNEILTAAGLEEMVFFGITYGAWVMLLLGFSLAVIVVLNIIKLSLNAIKLKKVINGIEEQAGKGAGQKI